VSNGNNPSGSARGNDGQAGSLSATSLHVRKRGESGMIAYILGSIGFLVIFAVGLQMAWNALQIAYSSLMVAFFAAAYLVVTTWEILVFILSLPFRLIRWLFHLRTHE